MSKCAGKAWRKTSLGHLICFLEVNMAGPWFSSLILKSSHLTKCILLWFTHPQRGMSWSWWQLISNKINNWSDNFIFEVHHHNKHLNCQELYQAVDINNEGAQSPAAGVSYCHSCGSQLSFNVPRASVSPCTQLCCLKWWCWSALTAGIASFWRSSTKGKESSKADDCVSILQRNSHSDLILSWTEEETEPPGFFKAFCLSA